MLNTGYQVDRGPKGGAGTLALIALGVVTVLIALLTLTDAVTLRSGEPIETGHVASHADIDIQSSVDGGGDRETIADAGAATAVLRAVPARVRLAAEVGEWRPYSILVTHSVFDDSMMPAAHSYSSALDADITSVRLTEGGVMCELMLRANGARVGSFQDRITIEIGPAAAVVVVSGHVRAAQPQNERPLNPVNTVKGGVSKSTRGSCRNACKERQLCM